MNEDTMQPDVRAIMKQIRQDIKRRNLSDEMPDFSDILILSNEDLETSEEYVILQKKLHELVNRAIEYDKEIKARSGLSGKVVVFFKKCIRKMIRFYTLPLAEDLNDTCTSLAQGLVVMRKILEKNELSWQERVDSLSVKFYRDIEKRKALSEVTMQRILQENAELRTHLDQMKDYNENLRKETELLKLKVEMLCTRQELQQSQWSASDVQGDEL